jgi:hypothetical protein
VNFVWKYVRRNAENSTLNPEQRAHENHTHDRIHHAGLAGVQKLGQRPRCGHHFQGTIPANGSYDLAFSLYTSSSGIGNPAGSVTNIAVQVAEGLFTVPVDFGAGMFDGGDYWLSIGVRTNGSGAALAAIRGLDQKLQDESQAKDSEIGDLKRENQQLAQQVKPLEKIIQNLAEEK